MNVGSSRLSLPTSRGYPRLIEADEEGTLSLLKALRAEVIDLPMMTTCVLAAAAYVLGSFAEEIGVVPRAFGHWLLAMKKSSAEAF